jgi:hypothetical protein
MTKCSFDPTAGIYKDAPIGMFHCPECGEMVVAGLPHPDWEEIDETENTSSDKEPSIVGILMTEEQILELAKYYFERGKRKWSVTDSGIVEFAKEIQDKLLKKLIVQLELELK